MKSILSLGDFETSCSCYQSLRLVVLILIASSLMVWPLTDTVHADDPTPYGEYRALVAQAYQDTLAAHSQSRAECAATLNHIADELEAVTAVRMPNGTVMRVEHCCGIEEALRATPCDTAHAEAYLVGICPGCVNQADGSIIEESWLTLDTGGGLSGGQDSGDGEQGQLPGGGGEQGDGQGGQGQSSGAGEQSDGQGDGQGRQGLPSGDGEQSDERGDGQGGQQGQPSGDGGQSDEQGGGQGEQSQSSGDGGESGGQGDGQGEQGQLSGDGDGAATDQPGRPEPGRDDQDQFDGPEFGRDDQGQPSGQAKENPFAMWAVMVIGSLLLAVGLAVLWMRRAPEPEVDPDDDDEEEEKEEEEDVTSPVEAVDRAQQLVATRDYRAAVRYLFLAALLALDERKLLHFDHTLTNHELLRDTRSNPALSAALTPITTAFDRVWYGFEPLSQSDYETLVEQIESLNQL